MVVVAYLWILRTCFPNICHLCFGSLFVSSVRMISPTPPVPVLLPQGFAFVWQHFPTFCVLWICLLFLIPIGRKLLYSSHSPLSVVSFVINIILVMNMSGLLALLWVLYVGSFGACMLHPLSLVNSCMCCPRKLCAYSNFCASRCSLSSIVLCQFDFYLLPVQAPVWFFSGSWGYAFHCIFNYCNSDSDALNCSISRFGFQAVPNYGRHQESSISRPSTLVRGQS